MEKLEKYILENGQVINGKILKVDTFLNHQVDPQIMDCIGKEFYHYFKKYPINKVVTIETSGIAPALMCALQFQVPLVFIKKAIPSTMSEAYSAKVFSFTKNKTYQISVSKEFLNSDDHILFIDDFLANGEAFAGVEKICQEANVTIEGVGIVIDKVFQKGHRIIKEKGYDIYSLAMIESLNDNKIVFKK